MSHVLVIDVGNSRIKFGLCSESAVIESASLGRENDEWAEQLTRWSGQLTSPVEFVIAGVVPNAIEGIKSWLNRREECSVRVIDSFRDLDLKVDVERPDQVGIDRLLGVLAAKRQFPNQSILVVDAGSAITINWVDGGGTFRGGAILPGLGLMASALHYRTAKLPDIGVIKPAAFPGRDTVSAIQCGIISSAVGAIGQAKAAVDAQLLVFTGGDGAVLHAASNLGNKQFVPNLVLEGIRIAAEKRQ